MATKTTSKNWQLILSLVLTALGILFFVIQALALSIIWLTNLTAAQTEDLTTAISTGLLAWASILAGIILLPTLLLSIYRLQDKPIPVWLSTNRSIISKVVMWLIFAWPLIVFLGWWIASSSQAAAFLLGPINLLAAGLPILWIYHIAQWKLEAGSQLWKWRIFGFSLVITPVVTILVELLAMLLFFLAAGIWMTYRMSVDSSLEYTFMHIYNQVVLADGDLDVMLQLLESYLLQPSIIFWAAAIFGGIMPMIEEIIKPLAIWLLGGRDMTPRKGFIGGVLCGAGFTLMENILYATTYVVADDWLFMAVGRAGTGVIHMLASGLVGWGLAKSWRDGKWGFQGITTLAAFFLHACWNVFSLVSGVIPLYIYGPDATLWQTLICYLPVAILLIISAVILLLIHRHFYKRQLSERPPGELGVDGLLDS